MLSVLQLLKNKLVEREKKKKKRNGSETSESEGDEGVEAWRTEVKKPLTELEKLQAGRKKLPVFKYREEILAAVKDHQVLVLSAETGSGMCTRSEIYGSSRLKLKV